MFYLYVRFVGSIRVVVYCVLGYWKDIGVVDRMILEVIDICYGKWWVIVFVIFGRLLKFC